MNSYVLSSRRFQVLAAILAAVVILIAIGFASEVGAQDTIRLTIPVDELPIVGTMNLNVLDGITISYSATNKDGGCIDAWNSFAADEGICVDLSTLERIDFSVISQSDSEVHLYGLTLVRGGDLREGLDQFDWNVDLGIRNFGEQLGLAARQIWNNALNLLESRDVHMLLRVFPDGKFLFGSWQQI